MSGTSNDSIKGPNCSKIRIQTVKNNYPFCWYFVTWNSNMGNLILLLSSKGMENVMTNELKFAENQQQLSFPSLYSFSGLWEQDRLKESASFLLLRIRSEHLRMVWWNSDLKGQCPLVQADFCAVYYYAGNLSKCCWNLERTTYFF